MLTKPLIPIKYSTIISVFPKTRLSIWRKARGMWRNKKPDPIKELAKMRKEWN